MIHLNGTTTYFRKHNVWSGYLNLCLKEKGFQFGANHCHYQSRLWSFMPKGGKVAGAIKRYFFAIWNGPLRRKSQVQFCGWYYCLPLPQCKDFAPSFTLKWGRSFLSHLDERRDKRLHYFSLKYYLRPPNFPQLISEQFLGKNMQIIGSYERICDQRNTREAFFKDWYV